MRGSVDVCNSALSSRYGAAVLRCGSAGACPVPRRFWLGYIADDPDDDEGPVVAVYCPPCAAKHFDAKPRARDYT